MKRYVCAFVITFVCPFVAHSETNQTPTRDTSNRYCSDSAALLRTACRAEASDDVSVGEAYCLQGASLSARRRCARQVSGERREALEKCATVFAAREAACALLGQRRYDPSFAPANFVDPDEIGTTVEANPYFPLIAGHKWVYQGGGETITDTITTKIKLIQGVRCRVMTDVVTKDGSEVEVTDDWFAQDKKGNVWYCGESSRQLETFAGDLPSEPELVEIGGSWKLGRERAKPGIIAFRNPVVGKTYRQEMKYTDAEDMATVLSITGTESTPGASCSGDCLFTRDFTPLDPEHIETKVYAPGIGLILEIDPNGERTELTEFTR